MLAGMLVGRPLHAQVMESAGASPAVASCDYRRCALTIAPRWNGLAVVAGDDGPTVANLNFLLPHDVSASLADPTGGDPMGADSVAAYARRAVRLRRVGAAFTDAGLVLGAVAALYATQGERHSSRAASLAAAGAGALVLSIPLQFAADGALSRAVWWHNLRYAR